MFAPRWIVTPSMLIVAVSGLLAMAVYHPFQNALWVWLKALSGLLIFEAALASVDGPARRAAKAAANLVFGVWRPRFRRKQRAAGNIND